MPKQSHRLDAIVRASDVPVKRIAAACDVHAETLARWRRGENVIPSDKLPVLASMLGVTPAEIMGWDDESLEAAA